MHFRNVAQASGVRFVHHYSATPGRYFVESAPGGLAVFDYNGDGRPDIFFTNGADTPSLEKSAAAYANRLYRNDGGMRFTDVTDCAGVRGSGTRWARQPADYDNDGHVDLFVAGVRQNQLLRNRGDGRFEDVTDAARASRAATGPSRPGGSTTTTTAGSICWSSTTCSGRRTRTAPAATRLAAICNLLPSARSSRDCPNRLYRNRGDGTFEDVSARAGLLDAHRQGHERRVRRLRPRRPSRRVRHQRHRPQLPVPQQGRRHVRRDGAPRRRVGARIRPSDLEHGHRLSGLRQRRVGGHRTSRRLPAKRFRSSATTATGRSSRRRRRAGSRPPTVKTSGWCTVLADVDNDGWKDIFTANSHVNDRIGDFRVDPVEAAQQPLHQWRTG